MGNKYVLIITTVKIMIVVRIIVVTVIMIVISTLNFEASQNATQCLEAGRALGKAVFSGACGDVSKGRLHSRIMELGNIWALVQNP